MTDSTFDRDDPPVLGANPFVGLTRRQVAAALGRLAAARGRGARRRRGDGARRRRRARSACRSAAATSPPSRGDRASPHAAWHDNPFYHRLAAGVPRARRRRRTGVVDEVELDDKSRDRARFAMSLLTEARGADQQPR